MEAKITQSVNSSDALLPPEASPKGVAMVDGSPPLPIHTLPPCPFQLISPHSPLTHIRLHPIFPFSKWPSPPIRTLNITPIHLLNKLLIFHPFSMAKPSQGDPFHPFHHTAPYPTSTPSCHISHAHSRCSPHPIYSLHIRMLLSDNSSLQHILMTAAPHSMSSSPSHMLELVRGDEGYYKK